MNDPFPTSKLGYPRQPLVRPLRLNSKNQWRDDKEFTVDDRGTVKFLRDCSEEEKQFILDAGHDIFARAQPYSPRRAAMRAEYARLNAVAARRQEERALVRSNEKEPIAVPTVEEIVTLSDKAYAALEKTLRAAAKRQGWKLLKDKKHDRSTLHFHTYALEDPDGASPHISAIGMLMNQFPMTLIDVARELAGEENET